MLHFLAGFIGELTGHLKACENSLTWAIALFVLKNKNTINILYPIWICRNHLFIWFTIQSKTTVLYHFFFTSECWVRIRSKHLQFIFWFFVVLAIPWRCFLKLITYMFSTCTLISFCCVSILKISGHFVISEFWEIMMTKPTPWAGFVILVAAEITVHM